MRSFVALQQVELGLNPDNILVARLPLPKNNTTPRRQNSISSVNCCSGCTRCRSGGSTETQHATALRGIPARSRFQVKRTRQMECDIPVMQRRLFPTVGIRSFAAVTLSELTLTDGEGGGGESKRW